MYYWAVCLSTKQLAMRTVFPYGILDCLRTNKTVGPNRCTFHKHAVISYPVLQLVTVPDPNDWVTWVKNLYTSDAVKL